MTRAAVAIRLLGAMGIALVLLMAPHPQEISLASLQPAPRIDDGILLGASLMSSPPSEPPPPPPTTSASPHSQLRRNPELWQKIPHHKLSAGATSLLSPLEALVTPTALRRSFGADPSRCGPSAGKCRLRLVAGNLYRGKACNLRRPNIQLLSALLTSALARHPPITADAEFCLFQGANPNALKVREGTAPILQWCTRSSQTLSLPTPYEADCVYKHRYAFTLEHHRMLLTRARRPPPPWDGRRPLAVWRGACTGSASLYNFAGSLSSSGQGWPPRARLALLSRRHPSLLDAVLFPCARCASLWRRSPELFGNTSHALTDADYAQYKYILDLDGDGCSGRLSKLLDSGSVVLKAWGGGGGYPFYFHAMKPWQHFVPIASDLSNLIERLEWLTTHDMEARAIARRAADFARRWLNPEAIDGYTYALLVGAARRQQTQQQRQERQQPQQGQPQEGQLQALPSKAVASTSDSAAAVVRSADLDLNFDLIYRADSRDGQVSYLNMTDHKERVLSVRCPAAKAEAWMLPVDGAVQLAQEYLDAAAQALSPTTFASRQHRNKKYAARLTGKRGREAALRAAARGYKLKNGVWTKPTGS